MAAEIPLPELPVLLSKAEALDYAARRLKQEASSLELASIFVDAVKPDLNDKSLPADLVAALVHAKKSLVDPKLQAAAMRGAADMIRDMALEERVVAARANAQEGQRA